MKGLNRGLRLFLCMLLVFGSFGWVADDFAGRVYANGGVFSGGSGTELDPYIITTPAQLDEVRNHLTSHFKLGADIGLTSYLAEGGAGYNNGAGWEPIGNNLSPFTGSMDGAGYRISGLKIDRQFNFDIGLFGRTQGKLENMSLEQIDVAGEKFVGGLAGTNEGIITNSDVSGMVLGSVTSAGGLIGTNAGTITESYATVEVTGWNAVGGLAGINEGIVTSSYVSGKVSGGAGGSAGGLIGKNAAGTITESYATVGVTGGCDVGGLVGENNNGTITNSHAAGGVTGSCDVGGLVGYTTESGTIMDSYATGEVYGDDQVGGLVGYKYYGTITNSYATGKVTGTHYYVGGLVGENYGGQITNSYATGDATVNSEFVGGLVGKNNIGTITNSYAAGKVNGGGQLGGLVGYTSDGTITNSYYDSETTGQSDTGKGEPRTTAVMKQLDTYKPSADEVQWWDFESIWGMNPNDNNGYPFLRWQGFGHAPFAAGSGTEADPYIITTPAQLDEVRNHLTSHFKLGADIDLTSYLGDGGAGYNAGAGWEPIGISPNHFIGSLDGSGFAINGLIINRPTENYMGLIGYSEGKLENISLKNIRVIGNDTVGGLLGTNKGGTITNSNATGEVTGQSWVGGLLGYTDGGTIANSYAAGEVTGNLRVGGLAGYNSRGAITNSYATGVVIGTGDYAVGGLLGVNVGGTIMDSYARGDVTGRKEVGGLVGYNNQDGTITNSYATGRVLGTDNYTVGGLLGAKYGGTVTNSYYDWETSGQFDLGKGGPRSTAEMKHLDTYKPGADEVQWWNFESIWGTNPAENSGYPFLRWQGFEHYVPSSEGGLGMLEVRDTLGNVVSLDTPFSSNIYTYNATVTNSVYGITVTPTVLDSGATVKVNGQDVVSGETSVTIELSVGVKIVTIEVTAEDNMTTEIYTLNVQREPSSEAKLSALEVRDTLGNVVSLDTSFSSNIYTYNATVTNSVYGITVTPTVLHSEATVKVNGQEVVSEEASVMIELSVGEKIVTIEVTAEDGSTGEYILLVSRDSITHPEDDNSPPDSGNNNPGAGGSTKLSKTYMIKTNGGTISFNGGQIIIPGGALDTVFQLTISDLINTDALPLSEKEQFVSKVIELTKDQQGKFQDEVTLHLQFSTNTIQEEEFEVSLYWLNEETDEWVELDNIAVDWEKGIVSGTIDHFTKFAVIAKQLEEEEKEEEQEEAKPDVYLTDIHGHWAEESIRRLVSLGAISGYPDGTFKPNHNITRAEFVTILVQALELEEKEGKVFDDTANHWARKTISTAYAYGIINGYDQSTFAPNNLITREQMAVMIVNALQLEAVASSKTFVDQGDVSAWAEQAVVTTVETGMMAGYVDSTIKPKANTTRAEAVTVILRAMEKK